MKRSYLLLVIVILIGLAFVVSAYRDYRFEPTVQNIFAQFQSNPTTISRIRLVTPNRVLDMASKQQGWVLQNDGDFPLEMPVLRRLFIALEGAKMRSPKTQDANQYKQIGVDATQVGKSSYQLTVWQADKQVLDIIIGQKNYLSQAYEYYVREPNAQQVWTIKMAEDLDVISRQLLQNKLYPITASEIQQIKVIQGPDKEAVIYYDEKEKAWLGKNRGANLKMAPAFVVSNVVQLLSDKSVVDVKYLASVHTIDFRPLFEVMTKDGHVLTFLQNHEGVGWQLQFVATKDAAANIKSEMESKQQVFEKQILLLESYAVDFIDAL